MNYMSNEFKQAILSIVKESNQNSIDAVLIKLDELIVKSTKDPLQLIETIDERCLFVYLFSNYMYQVNNGGHAQYFDNGYASSETYYKGYFSNKTDNFDIHEKMIFLFKKYFDVKNNLIYSEFLSILDAFKDNIFFEDCLECGGGGELEYEDEDGFSYETCHYCNGSGQSDILTFNQDSNLDNQFYELSAKLLENFYADINKWLISDDIITFEVTKSEKKPIIKLIGTNGNAFAIIANCEEKFREINRRDLIPEFRKKAMSGDYNHLLCVCMEYFTIC